MTSLGRHDGEPLVVDLHDQLIKTPGQLWDALAQPCGLPDWFGRNLDAWNDTLGGGISATLDEHPLLIIEISPRGLFAPGNREGQAFIEVSDATGYARIDIADNPTEPVSPTDEL